MIWWVMIFCGVVTLFTRFVMFSDMAPKKLPDWSEDVLSFVPVAVLTAIIVPSVLKLCSHFNTAFITANFLQQNKYMCD